MGSVPVPRAKAEPLELHAHAMDNLRFIRETMERAGSFTAVPGRGGILMGATALIAALVAARQPSLTAWLAIWLVEAMIAVGIGAVTAANKARAAKTRSEEHTSELQSHSDLVCRLLLEKKK